MKPLIIPSNFILKNEKSKDDLMKEVDKIFKILPEDTFKTSEMSISRLDTGIFIYIDFPLFYAEDVMASLALRKVLPQELAGTDISQLFEISIQAYSDPNTEDQFAKLIRNHPKKFFTNEVRYYFGDTKITKTIEIPEEIKIDRRPLSDYPLYFSPVTSGDKTYIQRVIEFTRSRLEEYWQIQTAIKR